MRKLLCMAMLVAVSVAAHAQRGPRGHAGMHHGGAVSMVRHHYVHEHGIDSRYAAVTSPLEPTAEDLERGGELYRQHCASCHGPEGFGDGEAGAALTPAPSNLAWISRRPIASDAYLFWTIAEGGAPIGSAMPPFKAVLTESDTWKIIAHVRELDAGSQGGPRRGPAESAPRGH